MGVRFLILKHLETLGVVTSRDLQLTGISYDLTREGTKLKKCISVQSGNVIFMIFWVKKNRGKHFHLK